MICTHHVLQTCVFISLLTCFTTYSLPLTLLIGQRLKNVFTGLKRFSGSQLNEAITVAQNRPLWGLMSAFGTPSGACLTRRRRSWM